LVVTGLALWFSGVFDGSEIRECVELALETLPSLHPPPTLA